MNVGAAGFKTDLAKKAYEGTFEIERELRSTQKKLSPCAAECEFLRGRCEPHGFFAHVEMFRL